jgi:hypothetical protein
MLFYILLLSASSLLWAAFGFAGLGARTAPYVQAAFSVIILLAAGSFVFAQAIGT